ncbi:MAG: response regulator transcription factor [Litorivicinus sp.]
MSHTILLVEDDPDQLANYSHALTRKGFECLAFGDADRALLHTLVRPELALLDVQLGSDPDAGFTLCQQLIQRFPGMPVVFISSRAEEIDQIFGLRLGAWDYLAKPISTLLLAEKVAAVLRQTQIETSSGVLQTAGWTLMPHKMRMEYNGRPANLTVTEFSIVEVLVNARGDIVTFDEMAQRTRQSVVTNNTLSTHIKHIRRKLKSLDPNFDALKSIYSRGYQWLD